MFLVEKIISLFATYITVFGFITFSYLGLAIAQEDGGPAMSRRGFIRSAMAAGATTAVGGAPIVKIIGELAPYSLSEGQVLGMMDEIVKRNTSLGGLLDYENYLSELEGLGRAVDPKLREMVWTHRNRVVNKLLEGQSFSNTEADSLKEDILTEEAKDIIDRFSKDSMEYNLFLVRGMLPVDLIRRVEYGLLFGGELSDFLAEKDLHLVYDYFLLVESIQSKLPGGSLSHQLASSYLEVLDLKGESPFLSEAPAQTTNRCHVVFGS